MKTAHRTIEEWTHALAGRQATPGGGGSAAILCAIGMATAAMACRYTNGKKHAANASAALCLAQQLDSHRQHCLQLADQDAAAYSALQSLSKQTPVEKKRAIEHQARCIPIAIIEHCKQSSLAIDQFRPRCNKWLLSDLEVGLHGIAGGARAAWQILLVNTPNASVKAHTWEMLQLIIATENSCAAS